MGAFSQGVGAGISMVEGYQNTQDRRKAQAFEDIDAEMHKEMAGVILSGQKEKAQGQPVPTNSGAGLNESMAAPKITPIDATSGNSLPADQQQNTGMQPATTDASEVPEKAAGEMPEPNKIIAKAFLTDPGMSNPDTLTALSNIALKYSEKTGDPRHFDQWQQYSTAAYGARKVGLTDALPHFLMGNGLEGAASLRRAGYEIKGTPVLKDKEKGIWTINMNGKVQDVNIKQMVAAADPKEYAKQQSKSGVNDSKIRKNDASIGLREEQAKTEKTKQEWNKARKGLTDAQTKNEKAGKTGKKTEPAQQTATVKEVEWYKSASEADKKLFDRLKAKGEITKADIAKMIANYTKDGNMTIQEAETKVNEIVNISRKAKGEKPKAGTTTEKPVQKTRDFDPVTRKFK